jgi:Ca2+-binding RTX toxin-like protein
VKQRRLFAALLLATIVALALAAPALAAVIDGDRRDNVLVGTNRADTIQGRGGDDRLYGEEDEDTLEGGRGDDRLFGGDGVDTLRGDAGNDRLYSAGRLAEVVNCGRGREDFAEVNPSDTVKGCEQVRTVEP